MQEEYPIASIVLEPRDGVLVVVWHEPDSDRGVFEHRIRVPPSYEGGDLAVETTHSSDDVPSRGHRAPDAVPSRLWLEVRLWVDAKLAGLATGRETLRSVLQAHSRILQSFSRGQDE